MEDKIIFQVPGCLNKIKSMSGNSWRIEFDTQDNISSEAIKRFADLKDKLGWMTVNIHQIEPEDIVDLPKIEQPVKKKSKSLQLRNVLYRLWEQGLKGLEFEDFYNETMDKLINHYKNKLEN
jgi:hypothetical protein